VFCRFYIVSMNIDTASRALLEHGRAQLRHIEECRNRAASAGEPHLCSAWIGLFVQLMTGLTETATVLGRLEIAAKVGVPISPLPRLRLPKLPALRNSGEGTPPPRKIPKTTAGGICKSVNRLAAGGSSPFTGEGDRRRRWRGQQARRCPPRRLRRHSPRSAGGEPSSQKAGRRGAIATPRRQAATPLRSVGFAARSGSICKDSNWRLRHCAWPYRAFSGARSMRSCGRSGVTSGRASHHRAAERPAPPANCGANWRSTALAMDLATESRQAFAPIRPQSLRLER
jgi:hypothetical protein